MYGIRHGAHKFFDFNLHYLRVFSVMPVIFRVSQLFAQNLFLFTVFEQSHGEFLVDGHLWINLNRHRQSGGENHFVVLFILLCCSGVDIKEFLTVALEVEYLVSS